MERAFLRASEVATSLGVTTNRVYQLINAGVIPVRRVGRSIWIPREAWERWLAEENPPPLMPTVHEANR